MTIAERIQEVEQTFNTKQAERDQYLTKADECLTEMTKLQGAWAILNEMSNDDIAKTTEANPEKASKK